MHRKLEPEWATYLQRYADGEWRASVFRDMILDDAQKNGQVGDKLTFLDIGCGGGFDSDPWIQSSIAQFAGHYIGIEPDSDIKPANIFSEVHRCSFEDAPVEDESVDVAFAVMVLEHIVNPGVFWNKIHRILRPGGVFWGFTVDARHWFAIASFYTEKLHLKNCYLDVLQGKRGESRYENYPVFYRSNTPQHIKSMTGMFKSQSVLNFSQAGEFDSYFPKYFRWVGRVLECFAIQIGLPGSMLTVRVVK